MELSHNQKLECIEHMRNTIKAELEAGKKTVFLCPTAVTFYTTQIDTGLYMWLINSSEVVRKSIHEVLFPEFFNMIMIVGQDLAGGHTYYNGHPWFTDNFEHRYSKKEQLEYKLVQLDNLEHDIVKSVAELRPWV